MFEEGLRTGGQGLCAEPVHSIAEEQFPGRVWWVVILIGSLLGFVVATVRRPTIPAALLAAAVVFGINCFTTAGLREFWPFILGFRALFLRLTHFPFTITIQAELGVMGGLFWMGASVQWRLLEVIRKKIDELKQLDTDRRMEEGAAVYRQSVPWMRT
ncbi:uncharacterized protein VP01_515g15 [Puccinia sorghi]|uniref:TM7S3/TM198-like domain-containing protein n=1 Tax=Puccinia sorghi TaxID=27349 RepID=A0A0L6UKZ6_9BASI|nr:uncharacterized protein VP01_515g15 [Puccinia sorghi]